MLAKSLALNADTLIFDLEDSVAEDQKLSARESLTHFLTNNGAELSPPRIAVRVNALGTPQFKDDIKAVLDIPSVTTLVLPKVHVAPHLDEVASEVGTGRPIDVVASIESALGVTSAVNIAKWQPQFVGSGMRMSALLFAAEDYCADTGVRRTKTLEELAYPRSQIAVAAHAYKLYCIDMVHIDFEDLEGLANETASAARLGFTGKQAIHPCQVDTIHNTFGPTQKDVEYALKIINGMRLANTDQRGAFRLTVDDRIVMIDAPMVKQAERTLRMARAAGLHVPGVKSQEEV